MAEKFMDRLIQERDELQEKLTKLEAFLANKAKAIEISGMDQYNLLIKQVDVMYDYLIILNERINKLQATID
jgi:tetrahydromethanopterin S-methyltransferase subunit B